MVVQVPALYQNWLDQTYKKTDHPGFARVFILHAVCILARAPKSRMLDHALMALYEGERPELPIPDYALDLHTRRGRPILSCNNDRGAVARAPRSDDPYES